MKVKHLQVLLWLKDNIGHSQSLAQIHKQQLFLCRSPFQCAICTSLSPHESVNKSVADLLHSHHHLVGSAKHALGSNSGKIRVWWCEGAKVRDLKCAVAVGKSLFYVCDNQLVSQLAPHALIHSSLIDTLRLLDVELATSIVIAATAIMTIVVMVELWLYLTVEMEIWKLLQQLEDEVDEESIGLDDQCNEEETEDTKEDNMEQQLREEDEEEECIKVEEDNKEDEEEECINLEEDNKEDEEEECINLEENNKEDEEENIKEDESIEEEGNGYLFRIRKREKEAIEKREKAFQKKFKIFMAEQRRIWAEREAEELANQQLQ